MSKSYKKTTFFDKLNYALSEVGLVFVGAAMSGVIILNVLYNIFIKSISIDAQGVLLVLLLSILFAFCVYAIKNTMDEHS